VVSAHSRLATYSLCATYEVFRAAARAFLRDAGASPTALTIVPACWTASEATS